VAEGGTIVRGSSSSERKKAAEGCKNKVVGGCCRQHKGRSQQGRQREQEHSDKQELSFQEGKTVQAERGRYAGACKAIVQVEMAAV